MPETVITVQGSHTARVAAERAEVSLSVDADGPDRDAVVAAVSSAAAAVRATIEPLAESGAIALWSSDSIRVWSQRPWSQDGAQLDPVQHATIDVSATFASFDEIARWIEQVIALDHVTVHGIHWSLTEATLADATAQVRGGAVEDAVAKATAYARSLGLGPVTATAIADPGMLGTSAAPTSESEARFMKMDGAGGSGEPLALKPEHIHVSAAVHARFVSS